MTVGIVLLGIALIGVAAGYQLGRRDERRRFEQRETHSVRFGRYLSRESE